METAGFHQGIDGKLACVWLVLLNFSPGGLEEESSSSRTSHLGQIDCCGAKARGAPVLKLLFSPKVPAFLGCLVAGFSAVHLPGSF